MSHPVAATSEQPVPVSKWIWPGILIALPASVIVASAITAIFVVRHPEGLVAADYYKQGKAINAQLAKSARAEHLGLDVITFEKTADGIIARFPRAQITTSSIEFVFAHPVDEAKDVRTVVVAAPDGSYRIPLKEAFVERRRVVVTDVALKEWRTEALFTP